MVHAPQCETSASRFASQPLVGTPSHSPKPALQVNPHVLAVQRAVPFAAAGQTVPHAPQLLVAVAVLVSQPSVALPLQLPKPALHAATAQLPAVHVAVAFGSAQMREQAPQLAMEVWMFTSHPLAGALSQSRYPFAHDITVQRPALHPGVPLATVHTTPQPPQLATDELRSVSHPFAELPSQSPRPVMQTVVPQTPAVHVPVQFAPHAPQFAADVWVFTSHPLATLPSQSAKPAAHVPIVQRPAAHTPFALAGAQTIPQPPQLAREVPTSISQPLARVPSQSAKPARHTSHEPVAPQRVLAMLAQSASAQQAKQPFVQQRVPTAQFVRTHEPAMQRSAVHALESLHCESVQHAAHVPPQFCWPAGHAHTPAMHAMPPVHATPHAPHALPLDVRSTSHPSDAVRLQSAKPVAQRNEHVPAAQVAIACAGAGQAVAQLPQCSGSTCVLAQVLPHCVVPVAQFRVQPLSVQSGAAAGHALPQAPQLAGSRTGTLQSVALAGQRCWPAAHTHVPLTQVSWAAHEWPHAPHDVRDVARSVSQPVPASLSQSPNPVTHAHSLAAHV